MGVYIQGSQHFIKKEIPWVFPDISLRKFQNSMRNSFLLRCVILDTWHKTHIRQTGENLSLLGRCHNFPEFPLFFLCFSQIPWVFPDWKIGNSFSRFSLISRVAGNPDIYFYKERGATYREHPVTTSNLSAHIHVMILLNIMFTRS